MASHFPVGLVSLLAPLLISSCGSGAHDFDGTVDGKPFTTVGSFARRLSGGALGIDLADYPRKCADAIAPNGSLIVSFVIDSVPVVGVHAVGETLIGSSTTASITQFSVGVDGGGGTPVSILLTQGSVTITTVSDAGVGGEARVSGAASTLSGSFLALWCSP